MLDAPSLERIKRAENENLGRWLRDHVDPVLGQIQAHFEGSPLDDVERAAILDKCLSPFVYWLRDQPSSVSQTAAQPVPHAPAVQPRSVIPTGAGSLSQSVPQAFMDQYGLYKTTHDEAKGWERLYMDRFLGPDYKVVENQLKTWGFVTVQKVEDGKSLRYFERRINP